MVICEEEEKNRAPIAFAAPRGNFLLGSFLWFVGWSMPLGKETFRKQG